MAARWLGEDGGCTASPLAVAHGNRVATMGQLSASITHEVNQPITAAVTYALALGVS